MTLPILVVFVIIIVATLLVLPSTAVIADIVEGNSAQLASITEDFIGRNGLCINDPLNSTLFIMTGGSTSGRMAAYSTSDLSRLGAGGANSGEYGFSGCVYDHAQSAAVTTTDISAVAAKVVKFSSTSPFARIGAVTLPNDGSHVRGFSIAMDATYYYVALYGSGPTTPARVARVSRSSFLYVSTLTLSGTAEKGAEFVVVFGDFLYLSTQGNNNNAGLVKISLTSFTKVSFYQNSALKTPRGFAVFGGAQLWMGTWDSSSGRVCKLSDTGFSLDCFSLGSSYINLFAAPIDAGDGHLYQLQYKSSPTSDMVLSVNMNSGGVQKTMSFGTDKWPGQSTCQMWTPSGNFFFAAARNAGPPGGNPSAFVYKLEIVQPTTTVASDVLETTTASPPSSSGSGPSSADLPAVIGGAVGGGVVLIIIITVLVLRHTATGVLEAGETKNSVNENVEQQQWQGQQQQQQNPTTGGTPNWGAPPPAAPGPAQQASDYGIPPQGFGAPPPPPPNA